MAEKITFKQYLIEAEEHLNSLINAAKKIIMKLKAEHGQVNEQLFWRMLAKYANLTPQGLQHVMRKNLEIDQLLHPEKYIKQKKTAKQEEPKMKADRDNPWGLPPVRKDRFNPWAGAKDRKHMDREDRARAMGVNIDYN